MAKRPLRLAAQSAMEYLMTYGWAILIIAVVLAALFELGVFNGSNLAPQACIAESGFICKNPVYTANGITFTFGQTTGRDYYGDWIFIASQGEALNPSGVPVNFSTQNAVKIGGPANVLLPGQVVQVGFDSSHFPAGAIPAGITGTPFAGYVWLGYCLTPCSSPTAYSKVATITVRSSGNFYGGGSSTTTTTTTSTTTTTTSTSTTTTSILYVASFSGSPSSYISISASALPTGSAARTIAFWAYMPSNGGGAVAWGNNNCYALMSGVFVWPAGHYSSSGSVDFWGGCDDGNAYVSVPDNTWDFIAVTYAAGSTSATDYSNGVGQTAGLCCPTQPLNTQGGTNLLISSYYGNYGASFLGDIANFQVYNQALSSSQIQTLYNEGLTGNALIGDGLVGWWPLDGNAIDYSGYGNNGAAYGVSYVQAP